MVSAPYNDFRDDFFKNGYCVVPSVIPVAKANRYASEALGWLESFKVSDSMVALNLVC